MSFTIARRPLLYERGLHLCGWGHAVRAARGRGHERPVGQEVLAQATHDEVVARVAASERTVKDALARGITVRAFVADWIAKQRERGLDWKNDESRLKHHVLPETGDLPLAEVRCTSRGRPVPQAEDGSRAQSSPVDDLQHLHGGLGPFRDAKLADLVEQSPCILDERQIGPLVDKDPESRNAAVFARDEVETIISDARISADRQMVYALELLAGVRPGEAAALHWRATTIRPWRRSARSWWRSPTTRAGTSRRRPRPTRSSTFLCIPCWPRCWRSGGSLGWPEMMGACAGVG